MAKKPTQKVDIYGIYDSDGNRVGELQYPQGSDGKSYLNREQGNEGTVYQPNDPSKELWLSTTDATVETTIDPIANKITVTGPKWLTEQVVNSDSFKENLSENSALSSAISLYQQNPNASLSMSDGSTQKVSDYLSEFQKAADSLGNYAKILNYKSQQKEKYGVDFDDTQVAVATNFVDKKDYKGNEAIYIPKWAANNYNWSSLDSWDAEHSTVSAKDFFDNVLKEGFFNKTTSEARKEALEELKKYLDNNAYDRSDEKTAKEREEQFANEDYKNDLARTIQFYNLLNENDPEISAAYNVAEFVVSGVNTFLGEAVKAGYNASETVLQINQSFAKTLSFGNEDVENTLGAYFNFLGPGAPFTASAFVFGEIMLAVESANVSIQSSEYGITDVLDGFMEDLRVVSTQNASTETMRNRQDFYLQTRADYDSLKASIAGWWSGGKVVGTIAWKIAENMAILNKVGAGAGSAVKSMFTSEATVNALGKLLGPEAAASLLNTAGSATGLAANAGSQALLETLLDNKEVVNKALESGQLTKELKDVLWGNFVGNLIGESMAPMFKGSMKVLGDAAEVSDLAKITYMGINKFVSGVSYIARSGLATVFALLNGVKPTAEGVAKAMLEAADGSSRKLALYNVGLMYAKAQASKNVAKIPIFREVSKAVENSTNANYMWIFGGEKFVNAKTAEEAQKVLEDTFKEAGLTEEVASQTAKDFLEIGAPDVSTNLGKNYDLMRKNILLRANLQNNIDAITKGKTLKWEEMKQYAGRTYEDFTESSAKVRQLEEAHGKLEYWEGGGTAMSKESSEYLSAKVQYGRYAWKIEQAEAAGGWKKAMTPDGNRIFKTAKDYDDTVEYAKALKKQMDEAAEKLGGDLKEALDDLHVKAGKFHMKVVEYMGKNGYMQESEYLAIKRLANNQGWGENGELYLPTNRLRTADDLKYGFSTGDAWGAPKNTPSRKMVGDDMKELQLGESEPFGDPVSNLFAWTARQASVAQAQDFGRALHAVSAPLRAVKGYSLDGVTKAEVSIVEKSTKDMKAGFTKLFDTMKNNSLYSKTFAESVQRTFAVATGAKEIVAARTVKSTTRAANAVRKRVEKALFQTRGSAAFRRGLISQADELSLTELISKYAGDNVPEFNVNNLRAADFKEWYDALPKTSQKQIMEQLSGQKLNITNVKKIAAQNPDFALSLKRNYVSNIKRGDAFYKTADYKDFFIKQYNDSVYMRQNSVLADDVKEYFKLVGKKEAAEEALKASREAGDFVKSIDDLQEILMDELIESTKDNDVIKGVLDELKEAGASEEILDTARKHLILAQVLDGAGENGENLVTSIVTKKTAKTTIAGAISSEATKNAASFKESEKVAKLIGKTLKNNLETTYSQSTRMLQEAGFGEYLDTSRYFENIQKEMDAITDTYGFKQGKEISNALTPEQSRKIVQLVGPDGQLRYYETSPLYAALVNYPVGTFTAKGGAITNAIQAVNALFRFNTTGMNLKSYVNQWIRDPINAIIVGGYRPFLDLSTGGLRSKIFSLLGDFGVPFTKKAFNKYATQSLTEEFVEGTFEASKRGLIEAYGQEWFDGFAKEAAGDLTGAEAEAAIKRATAQFAVGDIGYEQLPGLGGVTTAEFFSGVSKGPDGVTVPGVSKARAKIVFGDGSTAAGYQKFTSSASNKFSQFLSEHSRGSFREEFLRKGVYTSQYRAALSAGMTHAEAKVWATRYALDATTDFGRTFMWGNSLIHSAPYLGAAINGAKSFWRLVEMDPVGVSKRLVGGLILPYARMLTVSLSDPKNREAYKNLKEYEKQDALIFVADGQILSVPCPQELSGFIAPFRHVIEKAADVQDNTWTDLIASDMLGIMPLDLSGFVNLDANRITGESTFSIQRGLEKFASGLMGPVAKTAYMAVTGHDPYTGQEIDKSYYTLDEDGDMQLMDSTKSDIAKLLSEALGHDKNGEPMLSASAALTLTQTLFGRSSMTVLDTAYDILNNPTDPAKVLHNALERSADSVLSAFEAGTYDKARSQWQSFYNQAIEMRTALVNNEKFQKAFQGATDSGYSDEKRAENKRIYNEMLDEYAKFVLNGTKNMKALYPDQYTNVRMASVMSLLVLPQGLTLGGDTAYDAEIRDEAYYQARNNAVNTFLRMGFPDDTPQNNALGTGYYDKYGQFQFKVFTPYQIEQLQTTMFGTSDRIHAEIAAIMKANNIKNKYSGKGYDAARAGSKADYKAYKNDWNAQVVFMLSPVVEKYGIETLIRTENDREFLDDYIFVDNPYKAKEYLKEVFQGAY